MHSSPPAPTIESASDRFAFPRENAFDILRLLLAASVVYSHAHFLGGFGGEKFSEFAKGQTIAGSIGVLGFFGVSGFLITDSFLRRPHFREYLTARFLRIFPGYWFCLILTAFAIAPIIAQLQPGQEWEPVGALRYLWRNWFLRVGEWNIGHVISMLPHSGAINGSTWSLFPEFLCYLLVLGCGLTGLLRTGGFGFPVLFGGVFAMHLASQLAPQSPFIVPSSLALIGSPFLLAFATGTFVRLCDAPSSGLVKSALPWAIFCAILLRHGGWSLFGPVALPYLLIRTGQLPARRLPVDLSYGLYLYHFPVLQLLAAANLHRSGVILFGLAGLGIASLIAWGSFVWIEAPMLRLKRAKSPISAPR